MNSRVTRRASLPLVFALGTTFPAIAAETPQTTLEEIVVTAERREQSLQSVAIAVTALSGEDLEKKSVRDFTDLQYAAPALTVADSSLTKNVNIRGIGLNVVSPIVTSGVAIFRDGLFAPSTLFLNEPFYDIAGVEVLRGPQGTFVGQNSTGGAVLIRTADPELGATGGHVSLQLGNYDNVQLRGATNLPLTDTLAARFAFNMEERESFFENVGSPSVNPGKLDQKNARVSLLWAPSDSLEIVWKNDFNTTSTDGFAQRPIPGTTFAPLAHPDEYTLNFDRQDSRNDERSVRTALQVNWEIFPGGPTLRSVSGYQYGDQKMVWDDDATSSTAQYTFWRILDRVLSQELNLISPDEGALKWVVGTYYMEQEANVHLTRFVPTQRTQLDSLTMKESYSLFGQVSYELANGLELQVGVRGSHDDINPASITVLTPGPTVASDVAFKDDNVTGKVAVNWKLNDWHFVYAFVADGYKSGGANANRTEFKPEKVRDYELGWKATLLDGRIRTQINGFYMDYDNFQSSIFDPVTARSAIGNAGASTIQGVEAQLQAAFGGLRIDASVAYVDSDIGEIRMIDTRALPGGSAAGLGVQCPAGVPSNPPTCFDYTPYYVNLNGRQNPFSPEWTYNLGVEYSFLVGAGELTPRVDYAHTDAQWATLFARAGFDYLQARDVINVQLTYAHGDWRTQAYVTNLTDETFWTGVNGNNYYLNAPRQFGVRIVRSF